MLIVGACSSAAYTHTPPQHSSIYILQHFDGTYTLSGSTKIHITARLNLTKSSFVSSGGNCLIGPSSDTRLCHLHKRYLCCIIQTQLAPWMNNQLLEVTWGEDADSKQWKKSTLFAWETFNFIWRFSELMAKTPRLNRQEWLDVNTSFLLECFLFPDVIRKTNHSHTAVCLTSPSHCKPSHLTLSNWISLIPSPLHLPEDVPSHLSSHPFFSARHSPLPPPLPPFFLFPVHLLLSLTAFRASSGRRRWTFSVASVTNK